MAKVSPGEALAVELLELQKEIEELEGQYDLVKDWPSVSPKFTAGQNAMLSEITKKLAPLRKQWDDKVADLSDPWKSLLMNKRARSQVKAPAVKTTGNKAKIVAWLKTTLASGAIPEATLREKFQSEGLGKRFRHDNYADVVTLANGQFSLVK